MSDNDAKDIVTELADKGPWEQGYLGMETGHQCIFCAIGFLDVTEESKVVMADPKQHKESCLWRRSVEVNERREL